MYSCGKLALNVQALSLRHNLGCYVWRCADILLVWCISVAMKSDPRTFQYFSHKYEGLFLLWPVHWWHAISCIFSRRVKLKVLWDGTPWQGGGVYGALSEGCVGGNCINTFSRPRTGHMKFLFLPFIFSFFHDPGHPKADSPKPLMQNRWRFFP